MNILGCELKCPGRTDVIIGAVWLLAGSEFITAFGDRLGVANLVAVLCSLMAGVVLSSFFVKTKRDPKTLLGVSVVGLFAAFLGYTGTVFLL